MKTNFLKQSQRAVGRRPASASTALPLHHCHKSCGWLVAYSQRDRTGDTAKQSQRHVTSPTSKMFRQHLKCSLTAPRRAGTSLGFFSSFYSASCLSLGDLVPRLGQPVDLLAPWPSAAVIPRRRSTAVHFNLSNAESRGTWKGWRCNVRLVELPGCRAATLTFLF